MHLYPGFDGAAANGLRYGAAVELRENFYGGNNINNYPTAANIASTTAVTTYGTAASPSANSSGPTVFVRRAFTYLASDQAGIVRLGQGDGVLGLFGNCIFTTQCWDAGITSINGLRCKRKRPPARRPSRSSGSRSPVRNMRTTRSSTCRRSTSASTLAPSMPRTWGTLSRIRVVATRWRQPYVSRRARTASMTPPAAIQRDG